MSHHFGRMCSEFHSPIVVNLRTILICATIPQTAKLAETELLPLVGHTIYWLPFVLFFMSNACVSSKLTLLIGFCYAVSRPYGHGWYASKRVWRSNDESSAYASEQLPARRYSTTACIAPSAVTEPSRSQRCRFFPQRTASVRRKWRIHTWIPSESQHAYSSLW
jgi:hypothetical protein